jgi:divalent metal cation (Fe/Co/Zn/Cd) transporter
VALVCGCTRRCATALHSLLVLRKSGHAVRKLKEQYGPNHQNQKQSLTDHHNQGRGIELRSQGVHNAPVSAPPNKFPPEIARRIIRIQILTLVWMMIEAVVSLSAAWAARSPALLGFGGDSAVELLSAAAVLRRFYLPSDEGHEEERAAKIAGGLLFALAAFVAFTSFLTLLGRVEARPSPVGIALLILAAIFMPWLARQKRKLSVATGSEALRADATESSVCGYLALIALAGLVVNAIWRVTWADPIAALTLLPLIVREGWEAMKGEPCCHTG